MFVFILIGVSVLKIASLGSYSRDFNLSLIRTTLKQATLVQTGQNGYRTVPFSVYIHNLMLFWSKRWVNSLGKQL